MFTSMAHAHNGVPKGFISGITHPVLGLDHLLAMISVGMLSVQIGGRAIFTVPASFVALMMVGGIIGLYHIEFGYFELAIALSVAALGAAIMLDKHMMIPLAMAFVGFFGFFHGYAHGLEIPKLATSWAYVAGFMLGTIGLHITGIIIAHFTSTQVLRYIGAIILGMGLHIIYLL